MDNQLEEEQEKILASLSQALPGMSSEETLLNLEEMEKLGNEGGRMTTEAGEEGTCAKPRKKRKNVCPFAAAKRRRRRKQKKSELVKVGTSREEPDSGFGTLSDVLRSVDIRCHSDSDGSSTSLESVSLLQMGNGTAMEVDGVDLAWNVKVFPPISDGEEEMKAVVDRAVQTENSRQPADGSIMRTVEFIGSVITLKETLSTKTKISRGELEDILKRLPESSQGYSDEAEVDEAGTSVGRRKDTVSCEAVRYVMRRTNAENVTEKSVDAVLVWLKEETDKDWRTVCCCWTGSVTAEAVDVINQAVDSDVIGIRKKVSTFLGEILDEIRGGHSEDAVQECRVAFLTNFCKSSLLQYDLINDITKKLPVIVSSDWVNTQQEFVTAKSTYFVLRLLQDLLRSFLKANQGHIFRLRRKDTDTGVLSMWKANWRRDPSVRDDTAHLYAKYLQVVREWCDQTDSVLNFCLKECPLLSLVCQTCSSLARELLSKIIESRRKVEGGITRSKVNRLNELEIDKRESCNESDHCFRLEEYRKDRSDAREVVELSVTTSFQEQVSAVAVSKYTIQVQV